jgi:predicted component of type VI protein secretion system
MGAVPHRPLSLAVAVALAVGGCGGGQHAALAQSSVTLTVNSPATCNQARPLQAVVRAVTLKQFVEDQYRTVAQLVVAPDESVLTSFVVFPGVAQTVTFTPPAKGSAAVYFLFTDATGTTWKQQLDALARTVQLELADDQIAQPGVAPVPATTPPSGRAH